MSARRQMVLLSDFWSGCTAGRKLKRGSTVTVERRQLPPHCDGQTLRTIYVVLDREAETIIDRAQIADSLSPGHGEPCQQPELFK